MAIDTNFSFGHEIPADAKGFAPDDTGDLLGLLRLLVGNSPDGKARRSWKGTGFNLIWRPNLIGEFGPQDFFLQLNLTTESLEFTEITGGGIANRSLFEKTLVLGGVAYTQEIDDSFDSLGQHFAPGLWINVPKIVNPAEPATVVRMASIPHVTAINLQGIAQKADGPLTIDPASITPFKIDHPTQLVPFAEEDLTKDSPSRTNRNRLGALRPDQLKNPNLFLSEANVGKKILRTTKLTVSSKAPDDTVPAPRPDLGSGTANIAFLVGAGTPPASNGVAETVTATFWIEEIDEGNEVTSLQIQYSQRVLINFSTLSWPHISVGTLHPSRGRTPPRRPERCKHDDRSLEIRMVRCRDLHQRRASAAFVKIRSRPQKVARSHSERQPTTENLC